MVDPGFSPGGAPTPKIAIIFQNFAKNCMKIKEFGLRGRPWRPPWIRQCYVKQFKSYSLNRWAHGHTDMTENITYPHTRGKNSKVLIIIGDNNWY